MCGWVVLCALSRSCIESAVALVMTPLSQLLKFNEHLLRAPLKGLNNIYELLRCSVVC